MRHNSVVSGYPKSTEISWIDGLSTGHPGFGASYAMLIWLKKLHHFVLTTLRTMLARDIQDARSTRDAGVSRKREESQPSSSSRKKQRASSSRGFQSRGHPGQGQIRDASQAGQMVCYHCQ